MLFHVARRLFPQGAKVDLALAPFAFSLAGAKVDLATTSPRQVCLGLSQWPTATAELTPSSNGTIADSTPCTAYLPRTRSRRSIRRLGA